MTIDVVDILCQVAAYFSTNWFWTAFWPNLASTFLGVLFGLPAALWLNKQAIRFAAKNSQKKDNERLHEALKMVVKALEHNQTQLQALYSAWEENKTYFEGDFDIAAWKVTKNQIVTLLGNPELQHQITFHFARLGTLSHLCSVYLDMVVGVTSAGRTVAQAQARVILRDTLLVRSGLLLTEAEELQSEIEKILDGLEFNS
jgi:hypothetical protein